MYGLGLETVVEHETQTIELAKRTTAIGINRKAKRQAFRWAVTAHALPREPAKRAR